MAITVKSLMLNMEHFADFFQIEDNVIMVDGKEVTGVFCRNGHIYLETGKKDE